MPSQDRFRLHHLSQIEQAGAVCTKNLNPYVMVMKPTEDRV
jgi:hypothetical protein